MPSCECVGEREAKKTRRRLAKKIKEAQLKKAAARLESQQRKESRQYKSNKDTQHMRLLRSTTVPTPAVEMTSFKRSHSHNCNSQEKGNMTDQEHGSPLISSSLSTMDELATPISSNKHAVSPTEIELTTGAITYTFVHLHVIIYILGFTVRL